MNNTTRSPASFASAAPWIVAALVLGAIVGWLDLSATEVQRTVLLIMLVGFAAVVLARSGDQS